MGSDNVFERLFISMFSSILTLDLDSKSVSFFTLWGPTGLFLGSGKGSKIILLYTHVVEQLSFSMFSSILIFDFYLILG